MNSGRLIEDGVILGEDGDNPDLESAFSAFADELHQDSQGAGYLKVYKLPLDEKGNPRANSLKQIYLFDSPMGESTVADVIQRVMSDYFLPGERVLTIRVTGHQVGKRGTRFQRILTLQKSQKEQPAGAQPSMSAELGAMMRLMQENQRASDERAERFMQQMAAMQQAQRVAAAPVDPVAMMMQIGTMMGTFQTMFSGMRPPIDATAVNPMAQMVQNLELLKKAQNLLGGNAPVADENNLVGVLKALMPIAAPALQVMANAQQAKAQSEARQFARRPRMEAPAPEVIPEPESTPEPTEDNEMFMTQAKQMLTELCDMAAASGDTTAAAKLVMDSLPEEYDDQLGNLVEDATNFQAKISLLCPRCREFPQWFESLRAAIAFEYTGPDSVPTQ